MVIFGGILIVLLLVQVTAITLYLRNGNTIPVYDGYSSEIIENTISVMRALKSQTIKKHIMSNSAEQYDSGKVLKRYKKFLDSDLMNDLMQMCEEKYHG